MNVFRRTLLYAGPPSSARWYHVARPSEKTGARALVYLRSRSRRRHRTISGSTSPTSYVPATPRTPSMMTRAANPRCSCPGTRSSRTRPTSRTTTPPTSRSHASLILGFADAPARAAFFEGRRDPRRRSDRLSKLASRRPRVRGVRSVDLCERRRNPPAQPDVSRARLPKTAFPCSVTQDRARRHEPVSRSLAYLCQGEADAAAPARPRPSSSQTPSPALSTPSSRMLAPEPDPVLRDTGGVSDSCRSFGGGSAKGSLLPSGARRRPG